jgi:2-desacetyl-2-hydroxyethyl bacteriochlorophyllide A dehydrogenase
LRAAVIDQLPVRRLRLADVPDPRRRDDNEVVIHVEGCGICGTDLHILDGTSYRPDLPFVLGHEPVGVVEDASEVFEHWVGCRVTATLFEGCGHCQYCQFQDERLCQDLRSIVGVQGRWGAFAERVVIPAAQLAELPEGLPSPAAATLVDAGTTAMNSVEVALSLEPAEIIVVGGGAVGFLVAEILSALERSASLVESQPRRRQHLRDFGYDVAASLEELAAAPDCIIECTGSAQVPPWALRQLRPRGHLILAGYARVDLDLSDAARKELRIRGVRSGSRRHLLRVLQMAAAGEIRLPEPTLWPLESINDAFEALRDGAVVGKAVIVPGLSTS